MRSGPAMLTPIWRLPYDGAGVVDPMNEYGGAFHAEVPKTAVAPTLYSDDWPGRLLPNARGCAKTVVAPLMTLPVMTSIWSGSAAAPASGGVAGVAAAAAGATGGAAATISEYGRRVRTNVRGSASGG